MIKSRSGKILIIDNDVLVNILDILYSADQFAFTRVIKYLSLTFSRIWIPGYVKKEFFFKNNDKRRKKIIKRVFNSYSNFNDCPINVGLNEIRILVGLRDEDMGEADAILQIQKAKSTTTYFFEDIVFLSNDKGALHLANRFHITTLSYANLKAKVLETGIALP